MGFDEQLLGLSKIETIDYRWLLRRGVRFSPGKLLRKEELKKKHYAALSAQSIEMATRCSEENSRQIEVNQKVTPPNRQTLASV
jgi:hypothetical protein